MENTFKTQVGHATQYAVQVVKGGAFSVDGKRVVLTGKVDRRTIMEVCDMIQASSNHRLAIDVLVSEDSGATWTLID